MNDGEERVEFEDESSGSSGSDDSEDDHSGNDSGKGKGGSSVDHIDPVNRAVKALHRARKHQGQGVARLRKQCAQARRQHMKSLGDAVNVLPRLAGDEATVRAAIEALSAAEMGRGGRNGGEEGTRGKVKKEVDSTDQATVARTTEVLSRSVASLQSTLREAWAVAASVNRVSEER